MKLYYIEYQCFDNECDGRLKKIGSVYVESESQITPDQIEVIKQNIKKQYLEGLLEKYDEPSLDERFVKEVRDEWYVQFVLLAEVRD